MTVSLPSYELALNNFALQFSKLKWSQIINMPTYQNKSPILFAIAIFVAILGAPSACAQENRFRISADAKYVTDTQLKLTWRRCVIGMEFVAGSCIGKSTVFTFEDAQDYVKKQAGWRLPTEAERRALDRVIDEDQGKLLFPNTPIRGIFDEDFDPIGGTPYLDKDGRLAYDYSVNNRHLRLVR